MSKRIESIAFRIIQRIVSRRRRHYFAKFRKDFEDPAGAQSRDLLDKIRRNEDSDYGRDHSFSSIHSVDEFRKQHPLTEYDDYEPYIDRLKTGDTRSLFGRGEKLLMFAMTSGTTGRAKYIPVTKTFLDEYREGSSFWSSCLAQEFNNMTMGRVLPIISPLEEEKTSCGLPCGAISGLIAKTQGGLVSSVFAAPFEASLFPSSRERHYAFLRSGAEHNVTLIVTANPSTLIQFAKTLEESADVMIRDLAQGTLFGKKPPFKLKKDPAKSRSLEAVLNAQGMLRPRDLWPNMQALACWKGGTLFHYLKHLPEHYGETMIKDLGLLASEGRFSLPLFSDTDDGLLNIFHHFLEFIPEASEDDINPKTLLAHELEKGGKYFLVITTSSGLYRYKLHDLIEVRGFYKKVPLIHFLSKGHHIASITGEKLTEYQVLKSIQAVAKEQGLAMTHFRMVPIMDERPHYRLLVEQDGIRVSSTPKYLEMLDAELQRENMEYAGKRSSGRLSPLEWAWVRAGTFSNLQKKSHRPEQYKPVYLETDMQAYQKYEEAKIL